MLYTFHIWKLLGWLILSRGLGLGLYAMQMHKKQLGIEEIVAHKFSIGMPVFVCVWGDIYSYLDMVAIRNGAGSLGWRANGTGASLQKRGRKFNAEDRKRM